MPENSKTQILGASGGSVGVGARVLVQYFRDVLGISQFLAQIIPNESGGKMPPLLWLIEGDILPENELALIKRMSEAIESPHYEVKCAPAQSLEEIALQFAKDGLQELIVVKTAATKLSPAYRVLHSRRLDIYGLRQILSDPGHKREVWNQMKALVALRTSVF